MEYQYIHWFITFVSLTGITFIFRKLYKNDKELNNLIHKHVSHAHHLNAIEMYNLCREREIDVKHYQIKKKISNSIKEIEDKLIDDILLGKINVIKEDMEHNKGRFIDILDNLKKEIMTNIMINQIYKCGIDNMIMTTRDSYIYIKYYDIIVISPDMPYYVDMLNIHDVIKMLRESEDRKSTRLNSSHMSESRMPSSA